MLRQGQKVPNLTLHKYWGYKPSRSFKNVDTVFQNVGFVHNKKEDKTTVTLRRKIKIARRCKQTFNVNC